MWKLVYNQSEKEFRRTRNSYKLGFAFETRGTTFIELLFISKSTPTKTTRKTGQQPPKTILALLK